MTEQDHSGCGRRDVDGTGTKAALQLFLREGLVEGADADGYERMSQQQRILRAGILLLLSRRDTAYRQNQGDCRQKRPSLPPVTSAIVLSCEPIVS
jgi:hypothetical protein